MSLRACGHEIEVRALVERGAWPQGASGELREHVGVCRGCGDVVLLMQAFGGARAVSLGAAPQIAPGILWWRAQLRRRNEAVAAIGRPILGAQIFALAVTLLMVAGLAVSQAKQGWRWLAELPQSRSFHLETLVPSFAAADFRSSISLVYLVPGLAMLVLLGGVVVYLASEKQ